MFSGWLTAALRTAFPGAKYIKPSDKIVATSPMVIIFLSLGFGKTKNKNNRNNALAIPNASEKPVAMNNRKKASGDEYLLSFLKNKIKKKFRKTKGAK